MKVSQTEFVTINGQQHHFGYEKFETDSGLEVNLFVRPGLSVTFCKCHFTMCIIWGCPLGDTGVTPSMPYESKLPGIWAIEESSLKTPCRHLLLAFSFLAVLPAPLTKGRPACLTVLLCNSKRPILA